MRRIYRAFRFLLTGDPIKTTWISGGVARNVTTYRNPGESSDHWSHRHIDALIAALAAYPPDNTAVTVWTSGGLLHSIQSNNTNAIATALANDPPDA